MPNALITDFAWPDLALEREILGRAGLTLVAGPARTSPAAAIDALALETDPVAILCCWGVVSAQAIANAQRLRHIARLGVGLDNIDVAAATARGVLVTNLPDYCVEEVSDHAIALLLAGARKIVALDRSVKGGVWAPETPGLSRIADLTIGIVGYGRIGRRLARKLEGFGPRVLAHNRSPIADPGAGVESVGLEALLARSDVVIVCAPLTEATHHLFDERRLTQMRRGAVLINVTRGSLVDTNALIRALESGQLSGAGLDVVEGEPDPPAALAGRADVIMTPHVAFSSASSVLELRTRVCEEVARVYRGEPPQQPCNPIAG